MDESRQTGHPDRSGWYPDPWFTGQRRYWTGSEWTSDVFPEAVPGSTGDGVRPIDSTIAQYGPAPTARVWPPPPPPTWGTVTPAGDSRTAEVVSLGPPPKPGRPMGWVLAVIAVALVVLGGLVGLGVAALTRDRSEPSAAFRPSPRPTSPAPATSPPSTTSPSAPAPSGPAPSGTPTPPVPSGAPATAASLRDLVVRQSDVPSGYLVEPIPDGTQVDGTVTIDLCASARYPSEQLRSARLQVRAVDVLGGPGISTEAVAYRSTAATEQAFAEIAASARNCPDSRVTDSSGLPLVTTVGPLDDSSWGSTPGVQRLTYEVTTSSGDGDSARAVVYLRRGPLLLGLYFPSASGEQVAVEGRTTIPAIVKLFEQRLLRYAATGGVPSPTAPVPGASPSGRRTGMAA